MSTELLLLYGASTVFALFVVFSTIVNWVRHKESQYSTASVAADDSGKPSVPRASSQVATSSPRRKPPVTGSGRKESKATESESTDSDPLLNESVPQEIVGQPYKRITPEPSSKSNHRAHGERELPKTPLGLDELEESVARTGESVDLQSTSEMLDKKQLEQDLTLENSIPFLNTYEAQQDDLNPVEPSAPEGTEAHNTTTVQATNSDEQVAVDSVPAELTFENSSVESDLKKESQHQETQPKRVVKPVARPAPKQPKTVLLKFALRTQSGGETITGARIQMIATKHGFDLKAGVFSKPMGDGSRAILSILPSIRPYEFDQTMLTNYRSSSLLIGMTFARTPECLNEFKTLMATLTEIQRDFGACLCDDKGDPMNKPKLINYINILRASFSTASETTEIQAAAMM